MDNKYEKCLPNFEGLMMYTQVPNSFLDNMKVFTIYEVGVYVFLCRKIIGWQDKKINLRDKISLSQIQDGLNISKRSVQNALNGLIEKGLIRKEKTHGVKNMKGTNEYILLGMAQNNQRDDTEWHEVASDIARDSQRPPIDIARDSHTKETNYIKETNIKKEVNNNKTNNLINKKVVEVLDYLNNKTSDIRDNPISQAESNIKHIRARLNEGKTIEQCKKVIDVTVAYFKNKTFNDGGNGNNALNPVTLFRPSNFEKYLSWQVFKKNEVKKTDWKAKREQMKEFNKRQYLQWKKEGVCE